jgi:hypothetical protein
MLIMFEVLQKNRLTGKLTYEICESKLSEGWPPQKPLYPRKEVVTGELKPRYIAPINRDLLLLMTYGLHHSR